MNIHHRPIFDTKAIIKHYSEKDGVPISYVCTSALNHGTVATDIFYRETPHPEFGNRYFAIYKNSYADNAQVMITNADSIEDLEFGMKEVESAWHYSQHRHDFYTVGKVSLDGGRAYFRVVGEINLPTKMLRVKDGKFVEISNNEEVV
jgi:hypothetical protein